MKNESFCFEFFIISVLFFETDKKHVNVTNVGILKLKKLTKRRVTGVTGACFGESLNREHNEENVLHLGISHRLVTESHTGRT